MDPKAYFLAGKTSEFVELGASQKGRLFRKQILRYGTFAHPNMRGETMVIDRSVAEACVRNFNAGVCDIVQVPLATEGNGHTENPLSNIGRVVGLEATDEGLFGTFDIVKHADDVGKTILGCSALLHFDYVNTDTGERVGPTILHVAATNRPYITGMDDFRELIAASAEPDSEGERPVVLTAQEAPNMPTLDELKATLSSEHNIDIDALMALSQKVEGIDVDALVELSKNPPKPDDSLVALAGALEAAGFMKTEKNEPPTADAVGAAVVQLTADLATERDKVAKLARKDAEREVEDLIKEGRVLPHAKDSMVELALKDRTLFDGMIPENAVVDLTEHGVDDAEPTEEAKRQEESEIARLTALATGASPEPANA